MTSVSLLSIGKQAVCRALHLLSETSAWIKHVDCPSAARSARRVQFARGSDGGFEQYAIKLMFNRDDYHLETALYVDEAVAPVLPELKYATDNASGNWRQDGYVFPPFMIMERGTSLFECAIQLLLQLRLRSANWAGHDVFLLPRCCSGHGLTRATCAALLLGCGTSTCELRPL